jgi:hypothetical protein
MFATYRTGNPIASAVAFAAHAILHIQEALRFHQQNPESNKGLDG